MPYTNEQLLGAIDLALKARDMDAVVTLLRALAVQSPRDAQRVLDVLAIAEALG